MYIIPKRIKTTLTKKNWERKVGNGLQMSTSNRKVSGHQPPAMNFKNQQKETDDLL